MDIFTIFSTALTLAILLGYINQRFFKLQDTIAIMSGTLILSLVFIGLQKTGAADIAKTTDQWLAQINFSDLLLKGMLNYLLFAGALTIDFYTLKSQKWEVGILATLSTILSTFIISIITYYMLPLLHLSLPYLYCLLFGALISPTDPIAVLTTFKTLGVSKQISMCVSGESLFNDGVGIVIFTTFYELTFNHIAITAPNIISLFLQQALGGLAFGVVLGWITFLMIKPLKTINSIVLITIAAVSGGYALALHLDVSGPLAMVATGMIIGNKGRQALSPALFFNLNHFWEIIDELLNALLFLLIGFELLDAHFTLNTLMAAGLIIPAILITRLLTIATPMKLLQLKNQHENNIIKILTWGGLRGGLAVALALSLPNSTHKDLILTLTYAVVVFAIIVQGSTIGCFLDKNQSTKSETTQ